MHRVQLHSDGIKFGRTRKMKFRLEFHYYLLLVMPICFCSAQNSSPMITLSSGVIIGKTVQTPNGNFGNVFLGVPFAKPPVGHLRFMKPEPAESWSGSLSCQEFREGCLSNSSFTKSPQTFINEDCLYLNVFTSGNCSQETPCPVIDFIHGGAWYFDSPRMFKPEVLIDNFVSRGVIMVSASYRLGSFGFWNTGTKDAIGNYAIYDMIEALRWIQREIRNFGGNPDNVTIMGYSSSAQAVSGLSLSPAARGLFAQCLSMSGTAFSMSLSSYSDVAKEFAKRVGCATDQQWDEKNFQIIASCMRQKDARELLAIQRTMDDQGLRFSGPRMDGDIFSTEISNLAQRRLPYPMMIGTILYESGAPGLAPANVSLSSISSACDIVCNDTNLGASLLRMADEVGAFAPCWQDANSMTSVGAPVYLYSFDYVKRGMEGIAPFHAQDVFFIFGLHKDLLPFPPDQRDADIVTLELDLFTNFAKFGNPTPTMNNPWMRLSYPVGYNYYSIDLPPSNKPLYHFDGVEFWTSTVTAVEEALGDQEESVSNGDTEESPDWRLAFWITLALAIVAVVVLLTSVVVSCVRIKRKANALAQMYGQSDQDALIRSEKGKPHYQSIEQN